MYIYPCTRNSKGYHFLSIDLLILNHFFPLCKNKCILNFGALPLKKKIKFYLCYFEYIILLKSDFIFFNSDLKFKKCEKIINLPLCVQIVDNRAHFFFFISDSMHVVCKDQAMSYLQS